MKFLLDSCISKFAVDDLRKAGHDVMWVPELKKDPGDDAILSWSVEEKRILVTADKDFGDLIFVFEKPHYTIVRLVGIRAKYQGKVILQLIDDYKDELLSGALFTVEQYRIRIRSSGESKI